MKKFKKKKNKGVLIKIPKRGESLALIDNYACYLQY